MDGKHPTVASLNGIVAAAHPQAALAGARLLAEGGNAFDAAAATAAALNVVEPYMSGLAGMGMATCRIAAAKRIRTLDFVTRVPSRFPQGKFKERTELARGAQGCGTPGNLAGWCELVRAYGRKTLAEVLAPAIKLAHDGFPLAEYNVATINEVNAEFGRTRPDLFSDWASLYMNGAKRVGLGDVLRQPALARTLEAIASEGAGYLYGGALGRAMVAKSEKSGGCLSLGDLETVEPRWLDPIASSYRRLKVHTLPPPAESFQYLLTLRILDGVEFGKFERNGVDHLDTMYRAIRLAAGVRIAKNNPDPEMLHALLGDDEVDRLRRRLHDGKPIEGPTEQYIAPQPVSMAHEHTTSFSSADREGNAVCITQSLGSPFGCGVVVPEHGICLNNFLNWGEVVPGGRNHLMPKAELALPLAPSIATRDDELVLVLGTPGSYGICQTQTQVMVQHLDYALPLQDAIDAPRARLWDGRRVQIEARLPTATLDSLRARGHEIDTPLAWTMAVGGMHGITRNPQTGVLAGACDPRRDGFVAAI
ncbi:MAG: gamma-glutamyltransferase [Hyphomicrobiales bacterium]|nr:gamma-glutamyltransferase [Hyphomicrobiales bacterium]